MQKYDISLLREITRQCGDSFYIIDTKRFCANYSDMLSAFRRYYANTHIAYSYKTNYLPLLCRLIDKNEGYAEIVSDMELYAAKSIGVKYDRIYHNGPYKKKEYVKELMINGGHVNIDAEYEVEFVKEVASSNPDRRFEVGIRCNLDIGQEIPSRFGINTENGDLERVIASIESLSNVHVTGCHIHLPFRSLESFERRMNALERIINVGYFNHLKYVSVGGGFMGHVDGELAESFSFVPPSYDDYAKVVAGGFSRMISEHGHDVQLIIEPGSALVADVMDLVTSVVSVKKVRNHTIATLSGSTFNMNPSVRGVNRPISVYNADTSYNEYNDVRFVGYTCIEGDVMYEGYRGRLERGDYVVFHNVGSYSIVMKPPFILPDIPVIEIGRSGDYTIVKSAQTVTDVFGSFTT